MKLVIFWMSVLWILEAQSKGQAPEPEDTVVKKGDILIEANLRGTQLAEIFDRYSGKKLKLSERVGKTEFSFLGIGPLKRFELLRLIELTLELNGFEFQEGEDGNMALKKIQEASKPAQKWELEEPAEPGRIFVSEGDEIVEVGIASTSFGFLFQTLTGRTLVLCPETAKSELSFSVTGPATHHEIARAMLKVAREKGFEFVADEKMPRFIKWQVGDVEKVEAHLKEVEKLRAQKPPRRIRYIPKKEGAAEKEEETKPGRRKRYVPRPDN